MKDAKRNFVIDRAIELFLERSISAVTIKDIAHAAGVGEATVYRYFSGRTELLVSCALRVIGQVAQIFASSGGRSSGFQKITRFYEAYLDLFMEHPAYYRFLNEFDAFCLREGVDGSMEEYADSFDSFKAIYDQAYREGVSDGTVRRLDDVDVFYYTSAHAILALCKSLSAGDGIIRQDKLLDNAVQIKTLINIILTSLRGSAEQRDKAAV